MKKEKNIKVLHLSYSDLKGGASISAFRLHEAINNYTNIESKMLVVEKFSKDKNVYSFENKMNLFIYKVYNKVLFHLLKFQKKKKKISQSVNFFSILNLKSKIKKLKPDYIHIHWINSEMISIKTLSRLNYKKIWTFTDMWPFSGTEHYPDYNRYKKGYSASNKPLENYGIDFDRFVWNFKKKYFKNNFKIVCISKWLKDRAKESDLFKKSKIQVIPCAINTKIWLPINRNFSRKKLNLPQNKKIFLFSCSSGTLNKRKGFDVILKIFNRKKYLNDKYLVIILGDIDKQSLKKIKFKYKNYNNFYMGDVNFLKFVYCSSDLLLMPSTLEAFGQTAIEAGSCNIPTVGFKDTGLDNAIIHKKTGYLCPKNNIKGFEKGIDWSLKNKNKLNISKRKNIIKYFDYNIIAKEYQKIYLNQENEIYRR